MAKEKQKKTNSDTSLPSTSSVVAADEQQAKKASWIKRTLSGSLYGRFVMSAYETFRATGTSVICLSPWGDSSPLILPCVRFRDLAVHAVIIGTGGVASIASPVLDHLGDFIDTMFAHSFTVDVIVTVGKYYLEDKADIDLEELMDKHSDKVIPLHSQLLVTTDITTLTATVKYKHTTTDALLGFFRSSLHKNSSLFSDIKETLNGYLAIEKGWMNPVLFASNRRPIIPRPMRPDIVFCYGPFIAGDYSVGQKLLNESVRAMVFCPGPVESPEAGEGSKTSKGSKAEKKKQSKNSKDSLADGQPEAVPEEPPKRRLLIAVIGIKPHRTDSMWSTSKRPGQSVIRYILMNGCPAVVIPVKPGCPLISWHTMTLKRLYEVGLEEVEAREMSKSSNEESVKNVAKPRSKWWHKVSKDEQLPMSSIDEVEVPQTPAGLAAFEEEQLRMFDEPPPYSAEDMAAMNVDGAEGRKDPADSRIASDRNPPAINEVETSSTDPTDGPRTQVNKAKKWLSKKSKDVLERQRSTSAGEITNVASPDDVENESQNTKGGQDRTEQMKKANAWLSKKSREMSDGVTSQISKVRQDSNSTPNEAEVGPEPIVRSPEALEFEKQNPLEDPSQQPATGTIKKWWRKMSSKDDGTESRFSPLEKVEEVIFEFLCLHVDWDRMQYSESASPSSTVNPTAISGLREPSDAMEKLVSQAPDNAEALSADEPFQIPVTSDEEKKKTLRLAVGALVAAAVKTQDCEMVEEGVDIRRAGIAMFRIP